METDTATPRAMAAEPTRRAEVRFRAMGSHAHVIVTADGQHRAAALLAGARARIERLESLWSRFRPTSEVSRLNAQPGTSVEVSWETALLVRRSIEAWHSTGGAFDPTVLAAMIAAGYDRDFAELSLDPTRGVRRARRPTATITACSDIEVGSSSVLLPHGIGFDPGGIGKGLAADLVATESMAAGARGVSINLGGDIRAVGAPTADVERGWLIDVEAPGHPAPLAQLTTRDGAVATSTTLLRQWHTADGHQHHLIDPRTGRPSDSDIVLVSVAGPEAWAAETLAKACLLRGSERVFDLLDDRWWALAMTEDGCVLTRTHA